MFDFTPTPNLTGLSLCGSRDEFKELREALHRVAAEFGEGPYVPPVVELWLAVAYELRRALEGDRTVRLIEEPMDRTLPAARRKALRRVEFETCFTLPEILQNCVLLDAFLTPGRSRVVEAGVVLHTTTGRAALDPTLWARRQADAALLDLLRMRALLALAPLMDEAVLMRFIATQKAAPMREDRRASLTDHWTRLTREKRLEALPQLLDAFMSAGNALTQAAREAWRRKSNRCPLWGGNFSAPVVW